MHPEISHFIEGVKHTVPQYFSNRKILEVGSLDINGSIRSLFNKCEYIGLDVGEGKGVDVVCPIHEYICHEVFNTVISTEMLEHDKYWQESLLSMYNNLMPNGLLVLTCAGPTRQEHGTTRTTPGDAPFTNDWYRNISIGDFSSILPPSLFTTFSISYARGEADLYFYGIKK